MPKIKRALLSPSDTTGLAGLAAALHRHGVELVVAGRAAAALAEAGIAAHGIEELTGRAPILERRVESLASAIHAGIVARRGSSRDRRELKRHGVGRIDLVVTDLPLPPPPAQRPGARLEEVFARVDPGAPALLRSAALNFREVAVVVEPGDYGRLVAELDASRGSLSLATCLALARKALARAAHHDAVLAGWAEQGLSPGIARSAREPRPSFPDALALPLTKVRDLRHGENPHQRAALYRDPGPPAGVAGSEQLAGPELSCTDLLDLDAAWAVAQEHGARPFVAIVRHTNPCGAGTSRDLAAAFALALEGDPAAAVGGVVGLSRTVTPACAARIAGTPFAAVIAPGYAPRALAVLRGNRELRVLRAAPPEARTRDARRISGGWVLQEADAPQIRDVRRLPVVTRRTPTPAEYRALDFAWRLVRHVKSSAVVFTTAAQLLGVGAGQSSRLGSCRTGAARASLPLRGAAAASDAPFPLRDGIDEIAAAGATAVIQPGGSARDRDAIAAADEHGLAMVFTGYRHFKH